MQLLQESSAFCLLLDELGGWHSELPEPITELLPQATSLHTEYTLPVASAPVSDASVPASYQPGSSEGRESLAVRIRYATHDPIYT